MTKKEPKFKYGDRVSPKSGFNKGADCQIIEHFPGWTFLWFTRPNRYTLHFLDAKAKFEEYNEDDIE